MTRNKAPHCLICELQILEALVPVHICRDHLNMIRGISPFENHHPEGKATSPETIEIPVNVHAVLTAKQIQWAKALKGTSDDPLIQIARRIRVTQDFIEYLSKASRRDSNFLIALSIAQQEDQGPDWWKRGGVAPLVSGIPDGN